MPNNSQHFPHPSTEIKKALIDRSMSVKALAKKLRKSRSAVSMAIHHPTVLPDVRRSVLKALELSNV